MVGRLNGNRVIGVLFALAFAVVFIVRRVRSGRQQEEAPYQPSQYRNIIDTIKKETPEDEASMQAAEGKPDDNVGEAREDEDEKGEMPAPEIDGK